MQITLTTKIDVPQSNLEGVLTTAIEGGISYWAGGTGVARRDDGMVFRVLVWDYEEPQERFLLDADAVAKGIRLLHDAIMKGDVHPQSEIGSQILRHLFADQDVEGIDMIDVVAADAIVQYACFEEIRFG